MFRHFNIIIHLIHTIWIISTIIFKRNNIFEMSRILVLNIYLFYACFPSFYRKHVDNK